MKRRERKILYAVIAVVVVFAGCGAKKQEEAAALAAAETLTATETPEETEIPEATESPEATPTTESKKETVTMYTLSNTALRKKGSRKSKVLEELAVNTKVKVLEENDKFCYVKADGKKGYVLSKKLTKSKKKAIKAEKKLEEAKEAALVEARAKKEAEEKAAREQAAAEQAARERAAEEAARAVSNAVNQESDVQNAPSAGSIVIEDDQDVSGGDSSTEREIVSEERYDDCDGSGHGYKIIHYSDGTEETVEY